jgi:hypothetical protein
VVAVSQEKELSPDGKAKLAAAWLGFAFTLAAIAGLVFLPGLRFVWIVLLVWGLATIPQVIMWREPARKEAREQTPRRRV